MCHQVLDLLDLGIGVRVHNHSEVLHQAEISAHGVSQARQLTELWDEGNLIPSASILVDEQWLVHVADVFVIASAVVLLIGSGSPLLIECCRWTLREVDPIDTIGLLIVARNHGCTRKRFLNCSLAVTTPRLSLGTQVLHPGQTVVCPNDLEADVNVEKDARLFQGDSSVKARPHLDVVSGEVVSVGLVEGLLPDSLELKTAQHRVEEDLHEVQVVPVGFFHHLNPLDADSIVDTIVFGCVLWKLCHLLEREAAKSIVDEELELLLDLITALLEHLLAVCSSVVGNLRLEFDSVLVDTLNVIRVEVDREVVRVQLQRLALGVAGTLGFLGEESSCSLG